MHPRSPTALAAVLATAALLLLGLIFVPVVLGYGIIDDAYISLRYAQHLAAGEGLVFNSGERVEGYSNFLWTVLLAVPLWLGLPGPITAVLGGQLFGAVAIWLTGRVHRLLQPNGPGPLPIYLAVACASPFVCYVASGLEVGLYAALWMAALYCFVGHLRAPDGGLHGLTWAGIWLAAASLTRPEAPLLVAFHVGYVVLAPGPSGAALGTRIARGLRLATPVAVVFGGFLVFRYLYYGDLLPNTYYAKVGMPSGQLLGLGLSYAGHFLLLSGAVLAFFFVVRCPEVRSRPGVAYLLGMLLTHVASVVMEGGDHMALYRFFAPAMPAFALLMSLGLEALAVRTGFAARPGAARVLGLATVLVSLVGSLALGLSIGAGGQSQHLRATIEVTLAEQWGAFGRWLPDHSAPQDRVALMPIGAIGYHSRRPILDMVGLTDAHIARTERRTGDDAFLGHEKFDNDYLLARRPRFVLAHHFVANSEPVSEAMYRETAHYPVHRDLLRRPEFHGAYAYRIVQEGPARYFFFYERRESP